MVQLDQYFMRQLLIATGNPGKWKEIKEILSGLSFEIKNLNEIQFTKEIEENGKSFAENAIIKATEIGEKTGLLTLAEDSGLEVDALGGKPGIYSARYCKGNDLDRLNKVLEELKGIPKQKRTARFKAVVAVYIPESGQISTFEGISKGYITDKPIGDNGFGYDPIFYNFDLGKTNGEATAEEKNRVSHRARALIKARKFLEKII